MKLSLVLLATAVSSTFGVSVSSISANSKMGSRLLQKARLLEEGEDQDQDRDEEDRDEEDRDEDEDRDNGDEENEVEGDGDDGDDGYYDESWMENFSLKFIGCHQVAQWNDEANEENDVRIQTKKHVHFRLCPTSKCNSDSTYGCSAGFGDYVIDMDTFIEEYLQNKEDVNQQQCDNYKENMCGCDDNDDEDKCLYKCFYNAGMTQCMNDDDDAFNLEDYAQCTQVDIDANARRLEGDDGNNNDYFIGPYCSAKGGGIVLGMFTEDTCTQVADDNHGADTYEYLTGSALPYSSSPIVDKKCYSCVKDYYNDDDQAEDEVRETCTNLYETAGKCEYRLENTISYPNDNACNFIQGIKVTPVKSNGVIHRKYHGTMKAAIAIAFFATLFVILAFYVCFLREAIKKMKAMRRQKAASSPKKKAGFFKRISNSFKKKRRKRSSSSSVGSSSTTSFI